MTTTGKKFDDFFFSSRRRHTRCGRDWSSDVCSSDLCSPTSWLAISSQWPGGVPDSPGLSAQYSAISRCSGVNVRPRSEEHTSELQSRPHLVCRLLLEKKKTESCHTSSVAWSISLRESPHFC